MVAILRPCVWANFTRSGMRAMVPSSFMISQITPDGLSPASREMSTAASVWPARTSTPPGCARSGNTWPGVTMSSARALGIDGDCDGACPVGRRDAGRDARARLDRDSESGRMAGAVARRHLRQAELGDAFGRQRQADQAAAVLGHEVDGGGIGHFGRDHEIALVLAILVVDQDEHPPAPGILDDLLDGGQPGLLQLGHCRLASPWLAGREAARQPETT